MHITLFNTLTRKKEPFQPLHEGEVRLYSCGPTVYNYAHIGNLRAYIFVDLLKKMFLKNQLKVNHVMNITDVGHLTSDGDTGEDKLEKGAARENKSVWDIAKFYTEAFQQDLERLNIAPPTTYCKATDHIQEQIALVRTLEDNGFTYQIDDGVYFDTSKFKAYGEMAKLDLENIKAGARVEMVEGKKNPTDFALWKFSPKNEKRQMEWESPWGTGFPGWHIECSAMSMKYLGVPFDIHTGGVDHIPIHHTNEIAQNQAATGEQVVKCWLHNEFLVMGKDKMAKSGENFLTLQTLIDKGYDPLHYRYFLLNAHYRKQTTFSWEAMESAKHSFERLKEHILTFKNEKDDQIIATKYEEQFLESINDDLNTPQALALVWEIVRDTTLSSKQKLELLFSFDEVLGLRMKEWEPEKIDIPQEVQELLQKREEARKNKDWASADQLRDQIQEKGFHIKDTPEGPQLEKV